MASMVSNGRPAADHARAIGASHPPDPYPGVRYPLAADHFAVVRRQWWVVLTGLLLGIAAGGAWTVAQPPVYEATTSVLMLPTGFDEVTVAGSRNKGVINPDTEARLVTSIVVARRARDLLRTQTDPSKLRTHVSVEVPPSTSILDITYAAPTPEQARAGAQAFAQAYLANRHDTAKAELATEITAVRSQIGQLTTQLQRLTDQITRLSPESSRRAYLETQRANLSSEITSLTNRLNQLLTTRITAGRIISDAQLPTAPSKPVVPLNLAGAGTAGLLAALLVAYLRERHDSRVRRGADLPLRTGMPLLAELPAHPPLSIDDIAPGSGIRGRLFDRLRNEVAAALPDGHRLVVVTGASDGAAATVVAANLAVAFARAGDDVTLVCGHLSRGPTVGGLVSRMLRVAPAPGFGEVLRGEATVDDASQPAPRHARLRVMTPGGVTSGAGLHPGALPDLFAKLRRSGRYVVVEAPSTAVSADAQRLGLYVDAAIIAVERRRTRYQELVDAAEQLRRVGTPLLGAVALSRIPVPTALPTASPVTPTPAAGVATTIRASAGDDERVPAAAASHATPSTADKSGSVTATSDRWSANPPPMVIGPLETLAPDDVAPGRTIDGQTVDGPTDEMPTVEAHTVADHADESTTAAAGSRRHDLDDGSRRDKVTTRRTSRRGRDR